MSISTLGPSAPFHPDPAEKSRVSKPTKVALVGAGYIADYHAGVLRELADCHIIGACDPSAARLGELCDRWAIPYRAPSLRDLLEICTPDVVHVLTPPATHYDVAKLVLAAGLHVLLEKPMVLTSAGAEELIELAHARNVRVGVNHNAVHHPAFRKLLSTVAANHLGGIEHVIAMQNVPLGQLKAGEHDHWMFREPRNVLFEQGPHPFSQVCQLLGPVKRASTLCSNQIVLRTGQIFFTRWQVSLECAHGTAQVFLSFDGSFTEWFLHVVGQDGSGHLDLVNNTCIIDRPTAAVPAADMFRRGLSSAVRLLTQSSTNLANYGRSTLRLSGRNDAYYLGMKGSIEEFYAALHNGHEPASTANARQVTSALELAAAALPGRALPPRTMRSSPRQDEVLVLGSTGFLGRNLVPALAAAGYPVRVMVRRPSALSDAVLKLDPTVVTGDVRDRRDVDRAVEGCRHVIHLVAGAPTSWPGYERLFVDGTRTVAESCLTHGVEQFQFASSIAAYYLGEPSSVVTETTAIDDRPDERCDYAKAKILAERLLMDLHRHQGLPVVIFRPGIVVGAGGPPAHLGVGYWPNPSTCIAWGARGFPLPFVVVNDVVDAMVSSLAIRGLAGSAFNLVGDVRLTASDYVHAINRISGRAIRLRRRSVAAWRALELFAWSVKAVGGKADNVALSWRELTYRTGASQFDCTQTKKTLRWRPVADPEQFIRLGIVAALQQD